MTVLELRNLLEDYEDEMELFLIAEDRIGSRRLVLNIHDNVDYEKRVILTGSLSKREIPREVKTRLC